MSEQEKQPKKKPAKYDDAETKKEGLPIETPYKHGDLRSKKKRDISTLDGYTESNE